MKSIFIPVLCFAVLLVSSCKKSDGTLEEVKDTANLPTATTNINNVALLKLVNDQRLAGCNCGATVMPPVSALIWSNTLAVAAVAHSKDMNATGNLSHDSSNGKKIADRITATGYKWTAVGENIAKGYPNEQAVFNGWITSEDHCKNIMNANYKEMGAAKDGDYWTQDFARPQ